MDILKFWPTDKEMKAINGAPSADAANKTHGLSRHPLYPVYQAMLQRCDDANAGNYQRYGGRGIKVCERWRGENGIKNFLADMGDRPGPGYTLERKDNDGPYSPDNCRWATPKEQGRNRRNNIHVSFEGKDRLLIELAEEHNIKYLTLYHRIFKLGWSVERAVTIPVRLASDPDQVVLPVAS